MDHQHNHTSSSERRQDQMRIQGDRISQAVEIISGIVTSFPPESQAHQILGDNFRASDQPDLAGLVYQLGLEIQPDNQHLKTRLEEMHHSRSSSGVSS